MPRRKELQGVANSLVGFLLSRSNDLRGYWALGCLCSSVRDLHSKTVEFDLRPGSVPSPSSPWPELAEGYWSLLERFCAGKRLPGSWVTSAVVRFNFDVPPDSAGRALTIAQGDTCRVSVEILDDRLKCHTASGFVYCRAHNPREETRRLEHMWRF